MLSIRNIENTHILHIYINEIMWVLYKYIIDT